MDWTDYTEVAEEFEREHGREPTPEECEQFAIDGMTRRADMLHSAAKDWGIP